MRKKAGIKILLGLAVLLISYSVVLTAEPDGWEIKLQGKRFYYLDEERQIYPVLLNEAQIIQLETAEEEFNKIISDRKNLETKLLGAGLLNLGGFSQPAEIANILLKDKWQIIGELGLDTVLTYLNQEKIITSPGEIAVDFHLHTIYSFDSVADIESLLVKADKKGLGALAITDHNRLDGVKEVEKICAELKKEKRINLDFLIIPAEEITTKEGYHIGALFIDTYIEKGMTAEETLAEIHKQNGLAIAQHPGKKNELGSKLVETLDFEAVEIGNGSDVLPYDFYRNLKLKDNPRISPKSLLVTSNSHSSGAVAWLGYTVVYGQEKTLSAIKKAVKEGQTRPVFSFFYRYYKSFFQTPAVGFVFSVLDSYQQGKSKIERIIGWSIFSRDFRVKTTWDDALYDFVNLVGIYKYRNSEDNPLKRPLRLDYVSATYGRLNIRHNFGEKRTNLLLKFMF